MNVEYGYAEVNGTKLYYEIAGQGETRARVITISNGNVVK